MADVSQPDETFCRACGYRVYPALSDTPFLIRFCRECEALVLVPEVKQPKEGPTCGPCQLAKERKAREARKGIGGGVADRGR